MGKNFINISHILICISFQLLIFIFTKNLFIGALAGTFFFAGREIAQTEYRNIQASQSKLRKDMPMLGGLDVKFWTAKSAFADLLIPSGIVFSIAFLF